MSLGLHRFRNLLRRLDVAQDTGNSLRDGEGSTVCCVGWHLELVADVRPVLQISRCHRAIAVLAVAVEVDVPLIADF